MDAPGGSAAPMVTATTVAAAAGLPGQAGPAVAARRAEPHAPITGRSPFPAAARGSAAGTGGGVGAAGMYAGPGVDATADGGAPGWEPASIQEADASWRSCGLRLHA